MNLLNPLGFIALLSIPVILYIHMLQRKSKKRQISTLFLLNSDKIEKKAGSRLEKLRNSKLLWLNIFAALLLTFLLLQIRKLQEQQVLKIVVVVDSSASVQAFWPSGADKLSAELAKLAKEIKYIDLKIMSSSLDEATIYSGARIDEARQALRNFFPSRSGHDFGPAIRRARSLIDEKGILILCSDHLQDSGEDIKYLLIGEPIVNVGFTGFQADSSGKWQAIVKNHSNQPLNVNWSIGIPGDEKLLTQQLNLKAGELGQLRGEFPPANEKMILSLEEDAFLPDNKLYAVKPLSKKINVNSQGFDDANELELLGILNRFEGVKFQAEESDFQISKIKSLSELGSQPGIYFTDGPYNLIKQDVTALNVPLIEGLNWQGIPFALAGVPSIPEGFFPILKSGKNDLMLMRETRLGHQLLCPFNLNDSEMLKSPAMIILMYRAIEDAKKYRLAYHQKNYETGNEFQDWALLGKEVEVEGLESLSSSHFRTPETSGFFSLHLREGDVRKQIMQGGVFYADAEEGDFSQAQSRNDINIDELETVTIWQERSFLQSFWLLILIIIVFYGWYVFDQRQGLISRRAGK
ncbi:BatA domain-containing protein [Lentisphaera profundi]|uniref:BatA domain-containing protein n=1 Tax=Lentisphaera profundi TaxID=1658616 RepID=A0ABY7VSZ0_9BACT|nr:BatA domain-containing protein [Lentisphaera profundi]WDE96383.1 BatA domain-containing protein [Lentisphaera profundi]